MADDPALVIGSAKELIESTAKAVLIERGWPFDEKKDDLPALAARAQASLALDPKSATAGPDGSQSVKKVLQGLITMTQGLTGLRNRAGTGHGPAGARVGLRVRHAHLAVNGAVTWCQLMLDTLADEQAPWRNNPPSPPA
jgi:hypothetical protein